MRNVEIVLLASLTALLGFSELEAANAVYLSSMPSRPWWNDAWTRRAPLLVANEGGEYVPSAIVDTVLDFGEAVRAADVRVVTPWETEVPVWAEAKDEGKVRLVFETDLRPSQSKPFLVYWGNPAAKRAEVPAKPLSLEAKDGEIRIANGVVDVTFDNLHRTTGFFKRLRLVGAESTTELLMRASGYAWDGFSFKAGNVKPEWSAAKIVDDNPFVKRLRFESSEADLEFALYAEQPRIDYSYTLKKRDHGEISVSWAVAGGCANDDLVYPGARGSPLSLRAALDDCTDCIPSPSYALGDWIGEGWYAIKDRKAHDVVGMVFDRPSLLWFSYSGHGQASGEHPKIAFKHTRGKGTMCGRGAIVAKLGDVWDVRREYRRLVAPVTVHLGKGEDRHVVPVRIPRVDRDFIADMNVGKTSGGGWESGTPLEGTDWCENIVSYVRRFGATSLTLCSYWWYDLELSEELFNRFKAKRTTDMCLTDQQRGQFTNLTYSAEKYSGAKAKEHIAELHRRGMSAHCWPNHGFNFWRYKGDLDFDPDYTAFDEDIQQLFAKMGLDSVRSVRMWAEGPLVPKELKKTYGPSYWLWGENLPKFFEEQDKVTARMKAYYARSKAAFPDKPVCLWNSENGEIRREMFMSEQVGAFDTVLVEMLSERWRGIGHTKHVAKRMRGLLGNRPATTVLHHYYFMKAEPFQRVWECEIPFICGVNGFSHENQTYDNYGPEFSEIDGDFFREAEYTRLGEKVAKMAPVKYLAVFRDHNAFRDDIFNKRTGSPYDSEAQQDGRCHALVNVRNLQADIVVNRFFTAKDLAPYKVVYVPEDPVFTEDLAAELLAYVKNGGGAVLEGENLRSQMQGQMGKVGGPGSVPAAVATERDPPVLADGVPVVQGQGRIVWYRKPLSDGGKTEGGAKAIREAIAKVGGVDPYVLESKTLDSNLQMSDEGLFLGVYNTSLEKSDKGRFTLSQSNIQTFKHSDNLFVLDVKKGVRVPFKGSFEFELAGESCGFYLIGDDAFTAVPEAKKGTVVGPAVAASEPNGYKGKKIGETEFKPFVCVEFARAASFKVQDRFIRRSMEAMLDVRGFDGKSYRGDVAAALKEAKYVHLQTRVAEWDWLFADFKAELRDLLKRGGSILFDGTATGPNAKAFLADVGVYDVNESAEVNFGDGFGVWSDWVKGDEVLAKDVPLKKVGWGVIQSSRSFAKWDTAKQKAWIVSRVKPEHALFVVQENVLGAGKVLFLQNNFCFTDWYENVVIGRNIVSCMLGMDVEDHAAKVREANGGPGRRVE